MKGMPRGECPEPQLRIRPVDVGSSAMLSCGRVSSRKRFQAPTPVTPGGNRQERGWHFGSVSEGIRDLQAVVRRKGSNGPPVRPAGSRRVAATGGPLCLTESAPVLRYGRLSGRSDRPPDPPFSLEDGHETPARRRPSMNPYALDIFDGYLRAQGIWAALVSNPFTLTWLTGYAAPIETGPSPFEGGPALGWVQAGEVTLVVSNLETASASACGAKVQEYVGYTIDEPLRGTRQMSEALGAVLKGRAGGRGRVGVEMDTLAAPLLTSLAEALPRCGFLPVDEAVAGLRAVKSSEEIAKLRRVLAVCDQAQAIVRHCLRAGASELELWGQVRGEIEAHVGGRLPALVDFVAGPRTAEIGGPPGGYVLREGDALMLDF